MISEPHLLFFADRFLTSSNPYEHEKFVLDRSRTASVSEILQLRNHYKEVSSNNSVLKVIFDTLRIRAAPSNTVKVLDIGVFMATFTIASAHAGEAAGLLTEIYSYEANPELLGGIARNLALHGVFAKLHLCAISSEDDYCQLDQRQNLISGRISASVEGFIPGPVVKTLPLLDTIDFVDGLVKIDIEGFEYQAMMGLRDTPALNNCFIIEFNCEGDAERTVGSTETYSDFLSAHFIGVDIGNWNWPQPPRFLSSAADYEKLEGRNSGCNTDIILFPRDWGVRPDLLFS